MPFKNSDEIDSFLSWLAVAPSETSTTSTREIENVRDNDAATFDSSTASTTIVFSSRAMTKSRGLPVTTRRVFFVASTGTTTQSLVVAPATIENMNMRGVGLVITAEEPKVALARDAAKQSNAPGELTGQDSDLPTATNGAITPESALPATVVLHQENTKRPRCFRFYTYPA